MNGENRREQIIAILRANTKPISGSALGKLIGVSRQVIVQDMSMLRMEGKPILSTPRGYLLNEPAAYSRTIKMYHTNEQTEDELYTIVDLGGTVTDVSANR